MTTAGHAEPGRFRGETLPDLLGPHTRLLFVGVNPGLSAVAVQAPFPRRGNRFYPPCSKQASLTGSSMPPPDSRPATVST